MNRTNNEMCKIAKWRQIPLLLPIINATLWFAWSFLSQELMSAHTSTLRVQALSIYRTLTHWIAFIDFLPKCPLQIYPFPTDRIKFRITVLNTRLLLYTQTRKCFHLNYRAPADLQTLFRQKVEAVHCYWHPHQSVTNILAFSFP